jgi:hypothetical protein
MRRRGTGAGFAGAKLSEVLPLQRAFARFGQDDGGALRCWGT